MKLVSVCMVKNEADIIERYVRINAKFIDTFVIGDDSSSDATLLILHKLMGEGFDIRLRHLNNKEQQTQYQQNFIMKELINDAKGLGDYVFLMDADEFIFHPRKEIETQLSSIPEGHYGLIRWKTFAPIGGGLRPSIPLKDCFYPCKEELYDEYKAIIPSKISNDIRLSMGNHRIDMFPHFVMPLYLCHFPVRSADQIMSKALLISHKFRMKKDKSPTEGYHIKSIAQQIRDSNYLVNDNLLNYFAHAYLGEPTLRERGDFPPFYDFEEPNTKHTQTLDIPPIGMLDFFLTEIIGE
jgi:glycosyltransferase involved in cell wall biosynthesis